ncbi:MAG: translational GTPase TypA [Planctomycetes bacterium]|nr:translational GTPase TypA [Planctomycetota bacterium]
MIPLRNVAIIAHVDHGKTTLVDSMLRQSKLFRDDQVIPECFLDSEDLERERGITILSKNISIPYRGVKINVIDTPGHADFSGEVERVLKLADGVLLLVDAFEGPMPQTRFVLNKALELGLKPIVVINKMDRADERHAEVLNEIFDLFVELGASDEQLDFPVLYASGREGWASRDSAVRERSVVALLDEILASVPEPVRAAGALQMQVMTLDYTSYVGRIGIGRVFRGTLEARRPIVVLKRDGRQVEAVAKQLFVFDGLGRTEVDRVPTGDLCAVVGVEGIDIGDTLADPARPQALPQLPIDEPTIVMLFSVNDSPFAGREGKYVTSRQLRERLLRQTQKDVALRVEETATAETFRVSGRGILHLSIFIEYMRREGYELQVGQPRVIFKDIDGRRSEPIERLVVEVPEALQGKVMEIAGPRRGVLDRVEAHGRTARMHFTIPSRGLIGLRTRLLTATAGEAVVYHRFHRYEPFKGPIPQRQAGAMVSLEEGPVVTYALDGLRDRGRFFVAPTEPVYRGQIVGEHCKEGDLDVNVQRTRKLSNVRSSTAERALRIDPPVRMSLEDMLAHINEDELVEVAPRSLRMRKRVLDRGARRRAARAS